MLYAATEHAGDKIAGAPAPHHGLQRKKASHSYRER